MYKKLLSYILILMLLLSNGISFAAESPADKAQSEDTLVVPKRIENEIYNCIVEIYGARNAKDI